MNKIRLIIVFGLGVLFTMCTPCEIERSTRTLLVYMATDNNLGREVAAEVRALQKGWHPDHGSLLVYADLPVVGSSLLRIRNSSDVDTIAVYGSENSASAETFSRVVELAGKEFPADSYGLVFFSHSSGWLPSTTLQSPRRMSRSVGQDVSAGTEIELSDFADAISLHFDFIIFESCLMGGVEVAYALKDKASYLLASPAELLSPGFTPVYPEALHYLTDSSLPLKDALIHFATAYTHYIDITLTGAYRSYTLCILDLCTLDGLASRVHQATGGSGFIEQHSASLRSLQYFDRPGSYGDYPVYPRFFDLDEYIQSIAFPDDYRLFSEQLEKTVVWKAASESFMSGHNGFPIRRFSGLTTYITQSAFPELNAAYRKTDWYKSVSRNFDGIEKTKGVSDGISVFGTTTKKN